MNVNIDIRTARALTALAAARGSTVDELAEAVLSAWAADERATSPKWLRAIGRVVGDERIVTVAEMHTAARVTGRSISSALDEMRACADLVRGDDEHATRKRVVDGVRQRCYVLRERRP